MPRVSWKGIHGAPRRKAITCASSLARTRLLSGPLTPLVKSGVCKKNSLTSLSVSLTGLAVKRAAVTSTIFCEVAESTQKTAAIAEIILNAEYKLYENEILD